MESNGIEQETAGDTVVVSVHDNLYTPADRILLHQQLCSAIRQNATNRIIVDFSDAVWFGASILDELIETEGLVRHTGGEIRLVGKSKKIDQILMAARVDRLKVFASVQCALASFTPVHAAA